MLKTYVCLFVIAFCKAPSISDSPSDQDDVVVHNIEQYNNDSYWTPERLASVQKYPNPRFRRSPKSNEAQLIDQSDNYWSADRIASAKPATMPKYPSNITKKLGLRKIPANHQLSSGLEVVQVDVTKKPFSSMGKLFYVDPAGNTHECSAQFVDTKIVLTAAHCVYSTDPRVPRDWNRHFMFIQQYKGDENDHTSHTGTPRKVLKALVSKRWYSDDSFEEGNWAYDFAFLTMGEPSIADHLTLSKPDDFEYITAAGYPVNYTSGQILHKYVGKKGAMVSDVVEMPNDPMGEGCSGGAWIAQKGSKYYAVGVNSWNIPGRKSVFSPRFTDAKLSQLVNRAKTELVDSGSKG